LAFFKETFLFEKMACLKEMAFSGKIEVFPEEGPLGIHRNRPPHPPLYLRDPSSRGSQKEDGGGDLIKEKGFTEV
jgi:hypothetical protein